MPNPDRIPVVIATGQAIERYAVVSVIDVAARAAEAALAEVPALRSRINQVSVVNMLSNAGPSPAGRLARRLGLAPARTEVSTIGGSSPQWLVNRAATAIAAGEVDAVLIAGAEALRSAKASGGTSRGAPSGERDADDALAPDVVVGDTRSGIGPVEMAAGLGAPVDVYALFESVIARRAGHSLAEHRHAMAQWLCRFTDVAAANPYAWFPHARTATELATVSSDNRLVSEPYPKRMCAVLSVDQGAAIVVTSLGAAQRAGVADRAVFCLAGAAANDVWFPSARPDPGSSPAIKAAARSALAAAGMGIDDIGLIDLYSCFPCAVAMAAAAMGIELDDSRGLTVTGGLPYFGGPGNNYTLHAIATMVERIRAQGGSGLVSGLGWYATKHAVGVYGSTPPTAFRTGDTTDVQRDIDASALEVAEVAEGPAVVVAATVAMGPGASVMAAPIIARLPDGRHMAAAAADTELSGLAGRNLVGKAVTVSGQPPRYRVAD